MILRVFCLALLLMADSTLAQSIDPYRFYPSAVGNKWRWSRGSDATVYDSEITKDSTTQDGRRFLFLNGSTAPRFVVDTARQVWQLIGGNPVLWYRLDAQAGDSFSVSMGGNEYKVRVTSSSASAFGHTVPAKVFSWSYGDAYPNYAIQWLVYGVGLYSTYSILYNLDDWVTGYIIDGATFGTLAGVTSGQDFLLPSFSLDQTFPNPFNPETTIRFSIGKDIFVRIDVFDILGRRVQTLVSENLHAGVHEVSFSGSTLPSGTYLVRMHAGDFYATRKILLVK